MNTADPPRDPIPAVSEIDAPPTIARIFADIRTTLNVDVVNLVWRHLATMPGALEWVWETVKPLYIEHAPARAEQVHAQLRLPPIPPLSRDTLASAGIDETARSGIRAILDSYHHTNARALVCLSAFLSRFEDDETPTNVVSITRLVSPAAASSSHRVELPALPAMSDMAPAVRRLVLELNGFGEDLDAELVASMYRHLSYWPTYLSLIRTLLIPLHLSGELAGLVAAVRRQGKAQGHELAQLLPSTRPAVEAGPVLMALRRFVHHPISRMTGICAILRQATFQAVHS